MKIHQSTNRENASALTFFDAKSLIAEQAAAEEDSEGSESKDEMKP